MAQITETTKLPYVNKTPIKLFYCRGMLQAGTPQVLYEGEIFVTSLWIMNDNGGAAKINICELDESWWMMKEMNIGAHDPYGITFGPAGSLQAIKFWSGLKAWTKAKTDVWCFIRGFIRDIE